MSNESDENGVPSQSHDPMTDPAIPATQPPVLLASKTDVGQVRAANEDSCDTTTRDDGTRLLVVADGMGGHRGGATASRTAVETILERFESGASMKVDAMLQDAIESANTRIFEMARADADLEGMGTTVVALVVEPDGKATVAHVGDSRAYRYRRGHLEPITTDHSVVAEMQRRGLLSADEAASHPRRNEILRSVGVVETVEVEVAPVELKSGDRFLLCSDGLSGVLSDDEIAAVVQAKAPEEAADELISLANARGGPDNITVQILSIPAKPDDGDPEATAPVELSDFGIEAIENKRRERKAVRRLGILSLALVAVAALYLGWKTFGTQTQAPTPSHSEAQPDAPPGENVAPPRRGIPR